ncbi:LCP family protein [Streptomyces mirabilis]|uniref:LCP family protein n=1 Tax=Streptomyces mirabilis TaxID=68239 RepID=UPI00369DE72E
MQTISVQKALDYARLRHGIGDGSDIGRMKRHQAFLSSLIKKVKSEGMNPTTLLPLANAVTKSLTVDPGLGSAAKLMDFATGLRDIDLADIKLFLTLPWRYAGERVAIVHPDADQLWAAIRADRTIDGKNAGGKRAASSSPSRTTVSGKGIRVAVYNGTITPHLGAKAGAALTTDGFTVTTTAIAAATDHTTTVIRYGTGAHDAATTLARLFPGAQLVATSTPELTLILGQDYATTHPGTAATPSASSGSSLNQGARSASDDPCAKLTYG